MLVKNDFLSLKNDSLGLNSAHEGWSTNTKYRNKSNINYRIKFHLKSYSRIIKFLCGHWVQTKRVSLLTIISVISFSIILKICKTIHHHKCTHGIR